MTEKYLKRGQMPDEEYILDFDDGYGVRCLLTKKNLAKHQHHPEMRRKSFIQKKIKEVIQNPDYIYHSYKDSTCFCFYLKEIEINGTIWYTKIIVQKNKNTYIIRTGWLINFIHEMKYNMQPLKKRP